MHRKNTTETRRVRTAADVEQAQKDLAEATKRLAKRNEEMRAYLDNSTTTELSERVANAPDVPLDDATERYRKFLDSLEARRSSSVPPPPKDPKK